MSDHETIRFKIARQDRPGASRYWERFEVPYQPEMNVISCLQAIAARPVTAYGAKTTPVVWDCNCLEEVCGACTMVINGQVRQSCTALIDQLIGDGDEIVLEPMSKFPVLRDLAVDRSRMFRALKKVHAWIPVAGYHDQGSGPRYSPEDQDEMYPLSSCMTCGCCLDVCPQYEKVEVLRETGESDEDYAKRVDAAHDGSFLGAAAISQAVLFNTHPIGKLSARPRLEALMEAGGITDCGNAQNCVKICPKSIPLTRSIGKAGRQTSLYSIKQIFLR